MSIITLTTDFGTGSPYVAAMKGVILSINPAVTLVDVTHDVRPQDIRHGAIVLDDVCRRFPPGTIHVAVVDPGVGTDRAILYTQLGQHHFVAPDNGLLSRLARHAAPSRLVRVDNPTYWLEPVSKTFHGRDIMAPVAAHLSLGVDPQQLGPSLAKLVMLDWAEPIVSPGKIEGEILDVDSFGNLVTNIDEGTLADVPSRDAVTVTLAGQLAEGIQPMYGNCPPDTLIALIGSTGRLELAVVSGSAKVELGARVGDEVTVLWE